MLFRSYTPVLTQQFTIELTDLGLPSTFCCAADIVPHARVISNVMPPCEANAEQVYDHYDCTATVPTFATIYLAIQLDAPTELFKSWGSDSGCAPNTLMCTITADGSRGVGVSFGVNWFRAYSRCAGRTWTTPCDNIGATMTLTSPSIGTMVSPMEDCDAYSCHSWYERVVPGEVVHVAFDIPAGYQLVLGADPNCSVETRSCDFPVDHGTFFYPILYSAEPGTPATVRAVPADSAATITWTASDPPGLDGPTVYTVVAEPGHHTVTTTSTTTTIPGLVNGELYSVIVQASNSHGSAYPAQAVRVVPIPDPTTYDVPWSTTELARMDVIAGQLGVSRAEVQQTGVYLAAFLLGLDPTAPPEPTTLAPAIEDDYVSTTWPDNALRVPRVIQDRLVLSGVDAHRFSVYLLSYLLSLTGH